MQGRERKQVTGLQGSHTDWEKRTFAETWRFLHAGPCYWYSCSSNNQINMLLTSSSTSQTNQRHDPCPKQFTVEWEHMVRGRAAEQENWYCMMSGGCLFQGPSILLLPSFKTLAPACRTAPALFSLMCQHGKPNFHMNDSLLWGPLFLCLQCYCFCNISLHINNHSPVHSDSRREIPAVLVLTEWDFVHRS